MKIYLSLAAALMTASFAFAQAPGIARVENMRRPDFSALKAHLALTDAQVTQLQDAQQQLRTVNRSGFEQLMQKEKTLRETLTAGSTDATAVGRLVLDIEALRKQIKAGQDSAVTIATAVLTAAQKAKLAELEAAEKLMPAVGEAHMLNLLAGPDRDVLIMGPHFEGGGAGSIIPAVGAQPVTIRRFEIRR